MGAMLLQRTDLMRNDFTGLEGCNKILNVTRPDVGPDIHRTYLEAGANAVETNYFGADLPNLAEYDAADRITELAEEAARQRCVLAAVGPSTKLPRLGHASFADLLAGGVDAIIVETCQQRD
jgi:5-methyltetrahydrofolate--homocysteine methyltransferase